MRWFLLLMVLLFVPSVSAASHAQYPAFSAAESGFAIVNHSLSVTDDVVYRTGWYSVDGDAWYASFDDDFYDGDPRFVDYVGGNLNLRSDSPLISNGFVPIPFDAIGVQE